MTGEEDMRWGKDIQSRKRERGREEGGERERKKAKSEKERRKKTKKEEIRKKTKKEERK